MYHVYHVYSTYYIHMYLQLYKMFLINKCMYIRTYTLYIHICTYVRIHRYLHIIQYIKFYAVQKVTVTSNSTTLLCSYLCIKDRCMCTLCSFTQGISFPCITYVCSHSLPFIQPQLAAFKYSSAFQMTGSMTLFLQAAFHCSMYVYTTYIRMCTHAGLCMYSILVGVCASQTQ